ncbi:cold shock domain-containing protein [Streptomyces agglomeratus]|uniref:cold shock domain-containing protein n=1 Tax=Streptomyces agglomeratus TaxID=285458 RepID=UPI00099F8028|nr:cold shock domain-containing protein [Streptomyces agglomeratus]
MSLARTARLWPVVLAHILLLREVSVVPRGTVKWFDPKTGVGVITWGDGEPDAVVYSSAIQLCCRARALVAAEAVILDVIKDSQGVWAANVCRAEPCC